LCAAIPKPSSSIPSPQRVNLPRPTPATLKSERASRARSARSSAQRCSAMSAQSSSAVPESLVVSTIARPRNVLIGTHRVPTRRQRYGAIAPPLYRCSTHPAAHLSGNLVKRRTSRGNPCPGLPMLLSQFMLPFSRDQRRPLRLGAHRWMRRPAAAAPVSGVLGPAPPLAGPPPSPRQLRRPRRLFRRRV
jgi:hypothetical protein